MPSLLNIPTISTRRAALAALAMSLLALPACAWDGHSSVLGHHPQPPLVPGVPAVTPTPVPPPAGTPMPPGAPGPQAPLVGTTPPAGWPPAAPVLVQSVAGFIPELGESNATGRKKNVDRLAVQIVS